MSTTENADSKLVDISQEQNKNKCNCNSGAGMGFTFLHSADWHIGKPYGSFDDEQAAVLRQARMEMVTTLAGVAAQHDIEHVLVAGDVFDGPGLATSVVRALLARLGQFDRVTWHLLPGNHDPASSRGIWERARQLGIPSNVIVHLVGEPFEIVPGVMLMPAPLLAKKTDVDPTTWMDNAGTPAGAIRIGLAHGGVIGFDTNEESGGGGGLIAPTRATDAGLNYLALGDWHGVKQVNNRCWYSGTPEPDKFPRNEPGNALVVNIAGPNAEPVVTSVVTRKFTWQTDTVSVSLAADLDVVEDDIRKLGAGAQQHLRELKLEGEVTLSERTAIEDRLEQLAAEVFLLEARLDGLSVVATNTDLESLGDGELRTVAERLQARADDAANPEAGIAMLALQKLFAASRSAVRSASSSDGGAV